MKKSILFFSLVLSVSYLLAQPQNPQKNIEDNFDKISNYIQSEKYDSVLLYIDTNSINFFRNINEHIYKSSQSTILDQDPLKLYMIVFIKDIITKNGFNQYDQDNALKAVLKNGRDEYQPERGLTNFNIQDDWANATYTIGGKETDKTSYFHKEDSVWKVNLLLGFDQAKPQLENILKKFNGSKQEMIESLAQKMGISTSFIYTPLPIKEK